MFELSYVSSKTLKPILTLALYDHWLIAVGTDYLKPYIRAYTTSLVVRNFFFHTREVDLIFGQI